MAKFQFFTREIKIGKKGQVTIPKRIRDYNQLKEDDIILVTSMPGGEMIFQKKKVKEPEDLILSAIEKMPNFDWRSAWEEVKKEHEQER